MNKHRRFLWFLFGLGSQLQLFGTSLCFTELFVYGAAIVLFASEWPYMKRNGMSMFFFLSVAVVANGALSCWFNHSPAFAVIRGMAVVSLLPCAIIVCHWMLRNDMANFRWFLVGGGVSTFLCTFIFQRSVDVAKMADGVRGSDAVADLMRGPLWWIEQINALVMPWLKGWYLQCPTSLLVALPMVLAIFAMFSSVSGRSTALGLGGVSVLVLIGGRKSSQIYRRFCKNFWLVCFAGIMTVVLFKGGYKMSVKNGWLGEEALQKYEHQTKQGEGFASLLLGGRMESFCGLIACIDKPIIGFGPWAMDNNGYRTEFLRRFGAVEDYNYALNFQLMSGDSSFVATLIPCHAYITEFWLWYGIMGLLFWLYVVFVLIRYLRQDCYAVPQWFMWLAASVPQYLWGVFFSPFSGRVNCIMFVVAILMVRAVRKGLQALPREMIYEIRKAEMN